MTPRARLAPVVERVREHLARRIRLAALLWAGVLVVGVLVAAWILAGPGGWQPGTPLPLILDVALVALLGGGAWYLRLRTRGWTADTVLARSMEGAAGLPGGRVRGSLELTRGVPPGTSSSLASRAETRVVEELDLPAERLAAGAGRGVARWTRRGGRTLAVLGAVAVLLLVLAPERSAGAWRGLLTPVALATPPRLPALEVRPGSVEVPRGTSVDVEVAAAGRTRATLRWQAAGDVARERTSPVVEGRVAFHLPDVRAPVVYRVEAPDGARSPDYRITPVDPLLVSDLTVELAYPDYLQLPAEELRGEVPPLALPAGTRVTVRGRASRELGGGELVEREGGEVLPLEVEGAAFRASWVPTEAATLDWAFATPEGEAARTTPPPLELTVVPDSAPRVRIPSPGRDTVLPLDLRQPLVLEAQDDHGVRTLELVAYRVTSLGDRQQPRTQRLDLGGTRGVRARPVLDVSEWGLLPGDTVRYFARARDNAPRAHQAVTREYVLRMPGAAELRREAQRRLEDAARTVEEMADEAARASEETREMERATAGARDRAAEPGRPEAGARPQARDERAGFEEREEMRRALEEQEAMESRVDSLGSELERLEEAMAEAGAADEGLRRDLGELQELLEEVTTPEARQRLQEALRELEGMDAEAARETLGELSRDQEDFRERLEESLERFRRAAVEQDFRATTEEAMELAREEEALAEAMTEDADPRGRAEQQEALEARAETMEERMERLEGRLQESGETGAARDVRSAREDAARAREAMEQAAREARQGRGQEAAEQASQAAREMDETARGLQEAQQQMAGELARAREEALRSAADDALSMARRQGEIMEAMEGATREEMSQLRSDVAASLQGVRNMADRMAAASAAAGGPDREVATGMGQAMEALQRSLAALENEPGAPSPRAAAEAAVEALNRVARSAMARAEQGGETPAGAMEQMQQMMENLAQQQGQLNNQAGQVMPMQLGQQAMQGQMQQLAQGQQGVAEQLGELSRQPGSQDASLGDLEALAQEAGEIARELAGGRLDADTRERQERLFHRLLDAGRSLEKEEVSEEREARGPGSFERGDVAPLDPGALNALRFGLPEADVLDRLTPAQRRLVIRYFERLNRGGTGGGPEAPPPGDPGGGGSP